jgi:hypothetical protein
MPNPIKYNASAETLALQKGNFWIGTGAVGKGPTSTTGYYNGITPPSGGYTIYLNKASGGPSIYCPANDAALISLTNSIAGASYTTAQQCFNYYYTQTDKMCLSQDYPVDFPYIVLDGLVLYVDAGITLSYPGSGTTWTDINGLGSKNNGTLTNGPTYNSANGGSIVFDGTDDYVVFSQVPTLTNQLTMECWFYLNAIQFRNQNRLISNGDNYVIYLASTSQLSFYMNNQGGYIYSTGNSFLNSWNHIVATYNGTNRAIYINGVLKTTSNASGNVPNGNILNIGAYQNDSAYTINGRMSQVRIYNKGLTSSEVTQNYNATKSRFGL